MAFRNRQRVAVQIDGLASIPDDVKKRTGTVTGHIMQRCGPEAYDVSLDQPLASEIKLLSWVPEHLITALEEKR